MNRVKISLFILAVVLLAAFIPPLQGVQRFVTILTQNITVSNAANFDGATDFDSTVDLSGATVTFPSSSSLTTLTVSGASALNGGITADTTAFSVADTTGNTVVSGTLSVTSATALNGGITADSTAFSVANTSGNTQIGGTLGVTGATTLTGNTDVAGTLDVTGATALDGGITSDTTAFSVADTTGNTVISGTLAVTGATTLTGNTDAVGTLQYGANDLYPLGYATVNQEMVCGTTATFTETIEVTPTGLTTVTYVIPIQITAPLTTAAFLTVSDPTTSTFVLSSWESDFTVGTTGIAAHYCAVGDQ